jgi:hypothetical protein
MPWVVRDAVDEINRAVGRRWQGLDRLLPPRAELPEGCAAPFVATGANGHPAGLAACRHEHVKSGTLSGEALVRHLHAVLDARGVDTTLLHYAQLNPLSAPFWSRMGYRPLWTGWEVRPAASLR